jgi:toxin YoeB
MRNIEFVPSAYKKYHECIEIDRQVAFRIGDLISDIIRNQYEEIGKPKAIEYKFKGYWSRRTRVQRS